MTDILRPPASPVQAWPGHSAPLGATADAGGTNFALWSYGAESVQLCLLELDEAGELHETRVQLTERTSDVWHAYLPGILPGQRYGYRVQGTWAPERGARFNAAKLLADPYARAFSGQFVPDDDVLGSVPEDDLRRDDRDSAAYVPHAVVVADDYDWGDDRFPGIPMADTVLYEGHVKGLTKLHPGVPEQLRGTYAGLAQPALIDHLRELGVTSLELLPVQSFLDEMPLLQRGLVNYWGYNTFGFFAPDARYSASGDRGEQVTEFRDMVKAMHAAGIEVILDVVYNHSSEGNQRGPTVSFRGIDNAGYYRLSNGSHYYDVTGCGNTLDFTAPHVVAMALDSLRYWVSEMHVDGFRFDLASALARGPGGDYDAKSPFLTAVRQDPVLSQVKLIAEPWDVAGGGYQVGNFPPPFAEWNDRFRDGVRDFWRGRGGGIRELSTRLAGSSDFYGRRGPTASVNFVTSHDGFSLRDLVSYDGKHNEANGEGNRDGSDENRSANWGVEGPTNDPAVLERRTRISRSILATLLLASGTPMLLAGDEMGRSQQGNNNAYCQDNELSWLSWTLTEEQQQLHDFTRALIDLRRRHPVLRKRRHWRGIRPVPGGPKDLTWYGPDGREATSATWGNRDIGTVGMLLSGAGLGERHADGSPVEDTSLLLVLHAGGEPAKFPLPAETWVEGYDTMLETAAWPAPEGGYPSLRGGDQLELLPGSVTVLRVRTSA